MATEDSRDETDEAAEHEILDFDEMLELDLLPVTEAAHVARDITVEWMRGKGVNQDEVVAFYKAIYQAARFPTLADDEESE